jgi:hypothetical protein
MLQWCEDPESHTDGDVRCVGQALDPVAEGPCASEHRGLLGTGGVAGNGTDRAAPGVQVHATGGGPRLPTPTRRIDRCR